LKNFSNYSKQKDVVEESSHLYIQNIYYVSGIPEAAGFHTFDNILSTHGAIFP